MRLGLFLFIITYSGSLLAQKEKTDDKLIDKSYTIFSRGVSHIGRSLDEFFSRSLYEEEVNESRLRFSSHFSLEEKRNHNIDYTINWQLALPRVEHRFNLILSNIDNKISRSHENSSFHKEKVDSSKRDQFLAGLRLHAFQTENSSLSTDAGVSLRWLPEGFSRLRARQSLFLGPWEFRSIGIVVWHQVHKLSFNIIQDFDRPLFNDQWLIRLSNKGAISEKTPYWQFFQAFSLQNRLSQRQAIVYKASHNAVKKPYWLATNYRIEIQYKKKVYHKWLFLNLIPFITWEREFNFDRNYGIAFSLTGIFGLTVPNESYKRPDSFKRVTFLE